jgi:hypothetical protein
MAGNQTIGPLFADAEKNVTIIVSRTRSTSNYYFTVECSSFACLQRPSVTNKQTNKQTMYLTRILLYIITNRSWQPAISNSNRIEYAKVQRCEVQD